MSKVIKKIIEINDEVTVDDPKVANAVILKNLKMPQSSDSKTYLNFKGRIDSTVEKWRGKIVKHASAVEQAKNNQIEEAYQNGYNKGFNDGLEKERAEREDYIDKHFSDRFKIIESMLGEAKKQKEFSFRELEKKVIELSISIAEKVIQKSLKADSEIIEPIVAEAMSHIINSETIKLKVSAQDYEIINSKYDKWFSMAGNVKEFLIEIDKRLSSGDCKIETEGGIIDASISSRLDILAEELLKVNK